jgi:hypothetical protein
MKMVMGLFIFSSATMTAVAYSPISSIDWAEAEWTCKLLNEGLGKSGWMIGRAESPSKLVNCANSRSRRG